uniref:Pc237, similar to heme-binding protein n=1 Tax=Panstrongylus chinai TaxID=156444 RepID=A0A286P0X4_9HEMI|nr:Pc237, similar to heme-binding protein [Panstrongylus chinai]
MKFVTVIAVVCYLFVATNSLTTPSSSRSDSLEVLEKCSNENNISLLIADKLVKHTKPVSNRDEKCLLSCFLKERGYYVNGEIDTEKILQYLKTILSDEKYKRLEGTFKTCVSKVDKNKDTCEIANDVHLCAEPS